MRSGWKIVWSYKYLYLLGLPGIVYFLVFKYVPMYGIVIAFMDYSPVTGFAGSEWVGLAHFRRLLTEPDFWMLFRNTMIMSAFSILIYFPAPILLALLLNEVRSQVYKRTVQTFIYFPHFLSWVVVVSVTYLLFSSEQGLVNKLIVSLGGERLPFLMEGKYFYFLIVLQNLWKEVGWNTIIYLAAIAGVNPALYEAAKMDGAGRRAQLWHVTLPSIMPTITILLVLNLGTMLSTGFEQLWLMQNPMVVRFSEVFDTYVYKVGVRGAEFSFSAAVYLFKSAISLALVVAANRAVKRMGQEGLW